MQSSQSKHVAAPEKKRGGAKWDGRTFLSLPKAFPVKSSGNAALNPQNNRAFVPSKCDCLQEKYHQVMNFWNRGGPGMDRSPAEAQRLFRQKWCVLASLAAGPRVLERDQSGSAALASAAEKPPPSCGEDVRLWPHAARLPEN